jgi:hypothetical protein
VEITEEIDQTLAHYGVPGMKWGVRKRRDSGHSGPPEDVKIVSRPGKKVEVSGGRNHPPHEDAKRAHAVKQKAKASTIHSLSNAEIKILVERMRLESDWAKIQAAEAPTKSKGRKFIEDLIRDEGVSYIKGKKGPATQIVEGMIVAGRGAAYVGKRRKS